MSAMMIYNFSSDDFNILTVYFRETQKDFLNSFCTELKETYWVFFSIIGFELNLWMCRRVAVIFQTSSFFSGILNRCKSQIGSKRLRSGFLLLHCVGFFCEWSGRDVDIACSIIYWQQTVNIGSRLMYMTLFTLNFFFCHHGLWTPAVTII